MTGNVFGDPSVQMCEGKMFVICNNIIHVRDMERGNPSYLVTLGPCSALQAHLTELCLTVMNEIKPGQIRQQKSILEVNMYCHEQYIFRIVD